MWPLREDPKLAEVEQKALWAGIPQNRFYISSAMGTAGGSG